MEATAIIRLALEVISDRLITILALLTSYYRDWETDRKSVV